jgi:hypothetical protein
MNIIERFKKWVSSPVATMQPPSPPPKTGRERAREWRKMTTPSPLDNLSFCAWSLREHANYQRTYGALSLSPHDYERYAEVMERTQTLLEDIRPYCNDDQRVLIDCIIHGGR